MATLIALGLCFAVWWVFWPTYAKETAPERFNGSPVSLNRKWNAIHLCNYLLATCLRLIADWLDFVGDISEKFSHFFIGDVHNKCGNPPNY